MRFSIIIPVYNVEKYIGRCMDTVMHQSFDDYEVIVVDDETPDNSMDIVRKYAEEFPGKIHMIRQKNTRQGGARNRGVTMARGEYILFVDSDDYVHTDMLRIVDERLRDHPCDILVFQHRPVTEQGEMLPVEAGDPLAPGMYHPMQDKQTVLIQTGPVNKAFRREFYVNANIRFLEKVLYEDGMTRVAYAEAESIRICEDVLYYYVQSESSSMRREVSEKMLDILTVTDGILKEFKERKLYESFREPLDCALIYGIQYILDRINRDYPEHPIQNTLADYLGQHFPDYRKNPYVSPELARALDCLLAHRFRWYHFRFVQINGMKEALLRIPVLDKLNQLRKKR